MTDASYKGYYRACFVSYDSHGFSTHTWIQVFTFYDFSELKFSDDSPWKKVLESNSSAKDKTEDPSEDKETITEESDESTGKEPETEENQELDEPLEDSRMDTEKQPAEPADDTIES